MAILQSSLPPYYVDNSVANRSLLKAVVSLSIVSAEKYGKQQKAAANLCQLTKLNKAVNSDMEEL